jgi:hypothetical protein
MSPNINITTIWHNFSKNQLDAQYLCFVIYFLRLLHPSTCFDYQYAHHQEVKLY